MSADNKEQKRKGTDDTGNPGSRPRQRRIATHGLFGKKMDNKELTSMVEELFYDIKGLTTLVNHTRHLPVTKGVPLELPTALEQTNRRVARDSDILLEVRENLSRVCEGLNELRTSSGLSPIVLRNGTQEPEE